MNELGIISEVSGARARVAIGSMVTDFLPVFQAGANSFKTTWEPLVVGEQCIVLPIRGELNSGVIIRGIETSSNPVPATNENIQITKFCDGVIISYDVSSHTLNVSSPKTINITCDSANLNAKSVNVKANDTTVTSPSINLIGNTTIQGGINTSGSGGGSGSINMNGTLNLTGDLIVGGNISDSRGDLTGHSHSDSDGYTSNPR